MQLGIIATAAAILVGSLALGTAARADDGDHRHRHDRDDYRAYVVDTTARDARRADIYRIDAYRDRSGHVRWAPVRRELLEQRIRRRVVNEEVPLRVLFGLDRDYVGYRVDAVVIHVRPKNGRGRIKLLANGAVVDRERAGDGRTIRLHLDDERILGHDLRSLRLGVRGSVFIRDIEIHLTRLPGHRVDRARYRHAEELARIILGGFGGYGGYPARY